MPTTDTLVKAQRRHMTEMIYSLEELQIEQALMRRTKDIVPPGWDRAHDKAPCTKTKKRMTIRLEPEVLDWYRSLGNGYQNRINQVLKTYMHAILSKHIEQPGDKDWLNVPI